MDLIDDLGNDMAVAFFIEKKHSQKIDSKEFLALIKSIRSSLHKVANKDSVLTGNVEFDQAARGVSG